MIIVQCISYCPFKIIKDFLDVSVMFKSNKNMYFLKCRLCSKKINKYVDQIRFLIYSSDILPEPIEMCEGSGTYWSNIFHCCFQRKVAVLNTLKISSFSDPSYHVSPGVEERWGRTGPLPTWLERRGVGGGCLCVWNFNKAKIMLLQIFIFLLLFLPFVHCGTDSIVLINGCYRISLLQKIPNQGVAKK